MIDNSPKKLENVTHILFTNGYVFGVNNEVPNFYYDAQYIMSSSELRKKIEDENPEVPVLEVSAESIEALAALIDQMILDHLIQMTDNLHETKIC